MENKVSAEAAGSMVRSNGGWVAGALPSCGNPDDGNRAGVVVTGEPETGSVVLVSIHFLLVGIGEAAWANRLDRPGALVPEVEEKIHPAHA